MVKFLDQKNFILVEQHFHTNGHGFNNDAKFATIETSEKYINQSLKNRKQIK